jgi:hypothetical protein
MQENHIRSAYLLHLGVGIILILVCYWDYSALKVTDWPYYYPFKIFTIATFLGGAYLLKKDMIEAGLAHDISTFIFYGYSFIGTYFLHPTYLFSFYEGFTILCIVYSGKPWRYIANSIWGVSLALISIHTIPEPEFVKAGETLKPHLQVVTIIFGTLSILVYFVFNWQRQKFLQLTNRFAFIGQQAAFLLHELKSPLTRFMAKNSEGENKDADYIYSIIEGVELLVSKRGPDLLEFEWKDIATYLREEFSEICEYYQITLELDGLEGRAIGHKSTLRLAIKNLVKNAIEAIAQAKQPGTIKVHRSGELIEVSNNGPLLTSEKIKQIFKPFYSEKQGKQNFGIGLHFVESVVSAHKGKVEVEVKNEINIFRIKLGEII